MDLNVFKSPKLVIACSETIVVEKPCSVRSTYGPTLNEADVAAFHLREYS